MNSTAEWLTVGGIAVSVLAAMISWFKAAAARRSAKAAELAAETAAKSYILNERKLGLDLAALKERWIEKLGVALRDHGRDGVTALLPMLPEELRPQFPEIMDMAAKVGRIDPDIWKRKREKWMPEWEMAMQRSRKEK